ncbi:MAG: AraC family transcriptional regulator [Bacteroidota bacterium]
MEERSSVPELDEVESLQVKNQKSSFPEHYHDTFCISLIQSGIEAIKMADRILYTPKNSISINNPFEIHANPLVEGSAGNSFTTLYLSPDLVDSMLDKKGVIFNHQQTLRGDINSLFEETVISLKEKNILVLEENLKVLLKKFTQQRKSISNDRINSSTRWAELVIFIENNLDQKISLDLMAKFMSMNKFNFAKEFKSRYGLSPINYVIMKKIFLAKSLIKPGVNLTEIAYQLDFADQAHFSRHFRRFIGVSPRAYQQQIR